MKFLSKKDQSEAQGLSYDIASQRSRIQELLLEEQRGFCAYSECYISQIDSAEIEHFDGRLKSTEQDGYQNWYLVYRWMNAHKPKKLDERFLPILHPSLSAGRIRYNEGIYVPTKEDDLEAQSLINYLGFNKEELFEERQNHIARIKQLKELIGADFMNYLSNHRQELSFCTALEAELELDLSSIL